MVHWSFVYFIKMERIIRNDDEFRRFYNCSFYNVSHIPLELRQNIPLGIFYVVVSILELVRASIYILKPKAIFSLDALLVLPCSYLAPSSRIMLQADVCDGNFGHRRSLFIRTQRWLAWNDRGCLLFLSNSSIPCWLFSARHTSKLIIFKFVPDFFSPLAFRNISRG